MIRGAGGATEQPSKYKVILCDKSRVHLVDGDPSSGGPAPAKQTHLAQFD